MNDEDRKKSLDVLIEHQAAWIRQVTLQHARLEPYRQGRLLASEAKIEEISRGQAQLIEAASVINNAILDTVKSSEAQLAEVESFLHDLDVLNVKFEDLEGWREAVLAAEDWREEAARNGRNRTICMHWRHAGLTTTEILLTLVELLDRHGFTPRERRDVLTHVRITTSG